MIMRISNSLHLLYPPPDASRPFIHPVQRDQAVHTHARSRTHIPHLDAEDIKLDAFVRKRLIAEGLAGCTDTLLETAVNPQSVVSITISYISQAQDPSNEDNTTYPPPRLRNPVSQKII
jgi:hypothetical protein